MKINFLNRSSGPFFAVGAFFLCLYGFWFYSIPFFMLALAVADRKNLILHKSFVVFVSSFLGLILVSELVGMPVAEFVDNGYIEDHKDDIYERYRITGDRYYFSLIKVLLLASVFLSLGGIGRRLAIYNTVKLFLIILCSIIIFQWLYYLGTGSQLDFAIGSVDARDSLNNSYRPTGLFFEPVSAAISLYLLMLYCLFESKKDGILLSVFLTTMVIMKSSTGFVFAVIAAYLYIFDSKKMGVKPIFIFITLVSVILFFGWDFLTERFLINRDPSLFYRLTSINLFFSEFDMARKLLGSGIGFNDCGCLLYDTPILWYLSYLGGVIWIGYFIFLCSFLTRRSRLFLVSVLIVPYTIFQPMIWLFIGLVVRFKREKFK